jgi:cobalt/nickel transport protein
MKPAYRNWLMIFGVVVLAMGPLLTFQGKKFRATDSNNSTAIEEIQPGYKPWFEPVVKPSGGEIETFLFASQAAIGAGITGYVMGLYKGRSEGKRSSKRKSDNED